MGTILRHLNAQSKFCGELGLEAIAKAVPIEAIDAVIETRGVGGQRERKLSIRSTILLCIAMNLYTQSLAMVLRKLSRGLRLVHGDGEYPLAGDSAICYRRYQLGARPMRALFRRVCRPMATPQTKGGFLFGLRTMAIDGTTENVPDTKENVAAFGRPSTSRGRQGAFPQVLCVYLFEVATRAIVDVVFKPCRADETGPALTLLRSVGKGMLLMWDRGLHSFEMVRQTLSRGAHFLGRVPAGTKPRRIRLLEDGTWLVELRPSRQKCYPDGTRRRRYPKGAMPKPIRVRLIEYAITDPARLGCGKKHQLITSLLNPRRYPAKTLICAYHERWESEIAIDEMDTHQRLCAGTLRSQKPVGVIQELYGLLIAHYAVHHLIHDAALDAGIDPDRIGFIHALEVIRDAIPEFQMVVREQHPWLYARLLRDIASGRLPCRRPRINPRVVKRQQSKFPVKRQERWPKYKRLDPFEDVVSLI